MTEGAGAQHLLRGGFSVAPFSSSVSVFGRCNTQTWSLASTAIWATWPRSQLFGRALGQAGSTWNCGTVCAANGEAASRTSPASQANDRFTVSSWSRLLLGGD